MSRRLADLSDRELAPLFNMTIPEVRRYRQPSTDELLWQWLSQTQKAEHERHHEWLLNLSVEEFIALRESDDPNAEKPHVREVPVDVAGRFRALQELLRSQEGFESRYPAAFESLFPPKPKVLGRRERVGLPLPSFGIRVLHNWVLPHVETQYLGSGADAHTSVSRWWAKDWRLHEANRLFGGPGLDELQGVHLAILSREEDNELVGQLAPRFLPEVEGVQTPEEMPIRLTDLRLAGEFKSETRQAGIRQILDLLHRPWNADHVVLWKLRVLGSEEQPDIERPMQFARYLKKMPPDEVPEDAAEYVQEMRKLYPEDGGYRTEPLTSPLRTRTDLLVRQFGDVETRIAAVSFAAAALWLYLDLDTPDIEGASSHRVAEQVEALASTIRKLQRGLRRSTEDLASLTANRSSGAQSDLPGNYFTALQNYRLGHYDLRRTAEWLGITPYSSKTGKGIRDWKARVRRRLQEGKKFEAKYYPRAASIFANSDNPIIRLKARRAYRGYKHEVRRLGRCPFYLMGYWARVSKPETKRGKEISFAYVQLGSCILQRIPLIVWFA
jgi:hypothetical protein